MVKYNLLCQQHLQRDTRVSFLIILHTIIKLFEGF